MDRRIMSTVLHTTAFFTAHPVKSVAKATIFWNTAITVDMAAKDMNRKNSPPQILPPAMWLNTLGRVMKISDGPASGWML